MNSSHHHLVKHHYENFPVGSFFIPKRYRKAIHLIYAFARTADDFADEGMLSTDERIEKIDAWQVLFEECVKGKSKDPFFLELASVVHAYHLSPELFTDLLKAFRRDSSNPTYQTFDEVLEYCRYSANPVGRLLLQLFNCSNDETTNFSDMICTALQLTNFWQDISVDTGRNRFYIPLSEMRDFGVKKEDLHALSNDKAFHSLLKKQVETAETMFQNGKPLIQKVSKDFRFELKLIWNGGMRILKKIKQQQYETRNHRPKLTTTDFVIIFFRAVFQ